MIDPNDNDPSEYDYNSHESFSDDFFDYKHDENYISDDLLEDYIDDGSRLDD